MITDEEIERITDVQSLKALVDGREYAKKARRVYYERFYTIPKKDHIYFTLLTPNTTVH